MSPRRQTAGRHFGGDGRGSGGRVAVPKGAALASEAVRAAAVRQGAVPLAEPRGGVPPWRARSPCSGRSATAPSRVPSRRPARNAAATVRRARHLDRRSAAPRSHDTPPAKRKYLEDNKLWATFTPAERPPALHLHLRERLDHAVVLGGANRPTSSPSRSWRRCPTRSSPRPTRRSRRSASRPCSSPAPSRSARTRSALLDPRGDAAPARRRALLVAGAGARRNAAVRDHEQRPPAARPR